MWRICPLGVKSCFFITGKYEDQSEILRRSILCRLSDLMIELSSSTELLNWVVIIGLLSECLAPTRAED